MLEAGGVMYEPTGLEGVMGTEGFGGEEHSISDRSESLPKLLDGRLSFWRTASSWRRSNTNNEKRRINK